MIRLFALFMAAPAKADDKDCRRQLQEMRFTPKEAKRLCDPKNLVGPNEWGWVCENPGAGILTRIKGEGVRLKRDALCE